MFGKFLDPDKRLANKLVKAADAVIAKGSRLASLATPDDRDLIVSHIERVKWRRQLWSKIRDGTAEDLVRMTFNKEIEQISLQGLEKELNRFSRTASEYATFLRMISK